MRVDAEEVVQEEWPLLDYQVIQVDKYVGDEPMLVNHEEQEVEEEIQQN